MHAQPLRFVADSPDHLRSIATDARVGDHASLRHRDRTVIVVATDGGPLGLVWEELRDAEAGSSAL